MTAILLFTALGLIGYTYLGFPLLLAIRGRLVRRPIAESEITPRVTMVIVAHNEVATIDAKLANVHRLDYPRGLLEVIVASDGSDDGTNERVDAHREHGVRLLECPRAGKIPALNAAVAQARGEIVVFSDANSMFRADALRRLVAPFADPRVGAVGGNQRYVPQGGEHLAGRGERLYWDYDRVLKEQQSHSGSMTSATGAIHAIRRELFRPVPTGVSDDFMTSTRAIREGYRLCFAADAVAYESVASSEEAEFRRKVRVMTRALRAVWSARELLDPRKHGFYSLQLLSHKVLRWSVCWLLLVVFATSVLLAGDARIYRLLLEAQLLFYGSAVLAVLLRRTALAGTMVVRLLGVPYYFCMANYAALRAWMQLFGGVRLDVWDSHRSQATGRPAAGA